MKTNDTPSHNTRSVVVQTTLRVCEVDDEVLVISDRGCQTTTTTIPFTDNQAVIPFLEFTPFSEIVKDSLKVIDLPRKALLQFDLNHRAPKKSASELNPKSALKKSQSSSERFSAENFILSLVPFPKMPQKSQEEQEIQTNLTVTPYILDEDDVANVCAQLSVQTSITFEPTDSLSEITPALKKALKHTKDFQSVIVDGKIITDYVDPADKESKKKRYAEEETEDSSSGEGDQDPEEESVDLQEDKRKEKQPSAKNESKPSEKTSEQAIKSEPMPLQMTEEEFEKNVQKILDKTVKNVYDFMAKIVVMYEESKAREDDNDKLSPEKKVLVARRLFPTLEEEDEEQIVQNEEENSEITKLQSETLDKPPPPSGSSSRKFLKPDDSTDTPTGASIDQRRSSALRMVTGLVRGPKWVIQKALGVDIDTGLPIPEKKRPENDISIFSMGAERNLEESRAGVEFVAVDSKEAIDRFTPKKKTPSKVQIQETIEETVEETEEITTENPKSTKENQEERPSTEQDKSEMAVTPKREAPTSEDEAKTKSSGSRPEVQFTADEPKLDEEDKFAEGEDLSKPELTEPGKEIANQENVNTEDSANNAPAKQEQDVSDVEAKDSASPVRSSPDSKQEKETVGNEDNDVNDEGPQTPNPSVNLYSNENVTPSSTTRGQSSGAESIGDSLGKSSSIEIPCECGTIHEGGAAPPALSAPQSQPETSIKFELTVLNDGKVTQNAVEGIIVKAVISRVDTKKEQSDGGADVINVSVIVGSQQIAASSTGQLAIDGPLEHGAKEEIVDGGAICDTCTSQEQVSQKAKSIVSEKQSKESKIKIKASMESKSQKICFCAPHPDPADSTNPSNVGSKDQIICSCGLESEPMESTKLSNVDIKQSTESKPSAGSKSQIICSCEYESEPTGSAKPSNAQIKQSIELKSTASAKPSNIESKASMESKSQIICSCEQEPEPTDSSKPSKAQMKQSTEFKPTGSANRNNVESKSSTEPKSQIICSCEPKSEPIGSAKPSKAQMKQSTELKSSGSAKPNNIESKASMEPKSQIICSCEPESEPIGSAKPSKAKPSNTESKASTEPKSTSNKQSQANIVPTTSSIKQSKVILKASVESWSQSKKELFVALRSQEIAVSSIAAVSKASETELKPRLESAKQSKVEFAKEAVIRDESTQSIKCQCAKDKESESTISTAESENQETTESNSDEIIPCRCHKTSPKQSNVTVDSQKSEVLVFCYCSMPPDWDEQNEDKDVNKSDLEEPNSMMPKSSGDSVKKKSALQKQIQRKIKRSMSQEGVPVCNCLDECKKISVTGPVKQCGSNSAIFLNPEEMDSVGQILPPCTCNMATAGKQAICTCTEECELKMMGSLRVCGVKSNIKAESVSREISPFYSKTSKTYAQHGVCTCVEECKLKTVSGPVKECGTQSEILKSTSVVESVSQEIYSKKSKTQTQHGVCTCVEECKLKTVSGPVKECGTQSEMLKSKPGVESVSQEIYSKKSKTQTQDGVCTCLEECKLKTVSGPVKECGTQSEMLKSKPGVESVSQEIYSKKSNTQAQHGVCTCVEECKLKTVSGPVKECGTQSEMLKSKPGVESVSQEIYSKKSKTQTQDGVCTCVEECKLKTVYGPVKECGTQSEMLKSKPGVESVSQEIYSKKSKTQTQDGVCTCVEECKLKTVSGPVKECGTQSEMLKSKPGVESVSQEIFPFYSKKSKTQTQNGICTCVGEYKLKTVSGLVKECGTQSEILKSKPDVESVSQEIFPFYSKKSKTQTQNGICTCVEEYKLKTVSGPVKECGTQSEILKSKPDVESVSQEIFPFYSKKSKTQTQHGVCTCVEECKLKTVSGPVKECGTQSEMLKSIPAVQSVPKKIFPSGSKEYQMQTQQVVCTCAKTLTGTMKECGTQSEIIESKSEGPKELKPLVQTKQGICTCNKELKTLSRECGTQSPVAKKEYSEKEPKTITASTQNERIGCSKSLPSNVKPTPSEICACKIQSGPISQAIIKSQLSSLMKTKPSSQKEITCICKRPDGLGRMQGDTCPCKTKLQSVIPDIISDKASKIKEDLILGPVNVCSCAPETPVNEKLRKNECPCSLQQSSKKYKESIANYMKKLLNDSINAKDPGLIHQHAACLGPCLQQLAENLDEIEGIGGKDIRCTGDPAQPCACSVEVLYVNGDNELPGQVDRSCACSIPRVKKPVQKKPSYRESISKYCHCDMESEPTPNLECMYEGDEDYNEMYMEELGDNELAFKVDQTESESECTCRDNELPEVVVDSDMCGTSIEMPWLSIALPPPGTYEIISNKPPKKICECWNLDLKDSVLSATEVGTEAKSVCECAGGKPQGSAVIQPQGSSAQQSESETSPAEVILPPSEDNGKPPKDAANDSSSDDESGCSCIVELDECENLPIGSTKFVYDNPCFAQNEPYMDPLYKYFPDDCDTYCGPFTEIHWSDILLPKKVKIRETRKSKSASFSQELPVVPTVVPNMESACIEPHGTGLISELEFEISFAQVASTLLKVEGGAGSQRTVSEISTISDVRMKVKRCPKDYVVTVFNDGKFENIEGEGIMKTIGSQPFAVTNPSAVDQNVSNFLLAIQTASHVGYTRVMPEGVDSALADAALLAVIAKSTDVHTDRPKKSSSLPNMSAASLTSAEFREKFPDALADYHGDEPQLDSTKQIAMTKGQLEPDTCYPCRKKVKGNSTKDSKITSENKKVTEEKVNTINADALSVDTIKSEEFRRQYNVPPPKYEDPHAMGLYAMPAMEQRTMDVSMMMTQNRALTANESSSAIEKPIAGAVKEAKIEPKIETLLDSTKPSCRCSKTNQAVMEKPITSVKPEFPDSMPAKTDKPLGSSIPSCYCRKAVKRSKINIQEITKREMQSINATIEEIKSKIRCMDIPELDNWTKFNQSAAPPPSPYRRTEPYSTSQQMPQFPPSYQYPQPSQPPTMYPCYYPVSVDQYTYSGVADYSMYSSSTYPSYSTYMESDITEEDCVCTCVKRKVASKRRRKRKITISSSEYSCTSTASSGSKATASAKSIPSCRKPCRKPKPISSESDNRCSQVSFSCDSRATRSSEKMEIMDYTYYDHTATDTDPEVEIRVGRGPPKIKTKDTFKGMITKEPNKCKFRVEVQLSPSKLRNLRKKQSRSETEYSSCGRMS